MKWKELVKGEMEYTYAVTEKLFDLVEESDLEWKPATGSNWMTTGQLLKHITEACGLCFKGFVTGDWGMPEGANIDEMAPEDMLPPAEKLPSVTTVAEAKDLLSKDWEVAREMLDSVSEDELENKEAPAPWDPSTVCLGQRLHQMVGHLMIHKSQLFYYLKLQGKQVHTGHLWGM